MIRKHENIEYYSKKYFWKILEEIEFNAPVIYTSIFDERLFR